jgi:hypothetical protein
LWPNQNRSTVHNSHSFNVSRRNDCSHRRV